LKKQFSYHHANLLAAMLMLLWQACGSTKKTTAVIVDEEKKNKSGLSYKQQMDFDYLFYNANKEKLLGNYDMAEFDFEHALKINSKCNACMYELANIYAAKNNKKTALEWSKKASTADPNNPWYLMLYAECLKDNNQPEQVAEVYEKLIKLQPEKIEYYYELANAHLYRNKPQEAINVYNRIENRIGLTEDVSMQKIKILKATQNFDKGIEETKKLIKTFPKESKYYGILGELYQAKKQPEKAFEAYNELIRQDSTNAYVHLSLADYYREQKQNEKAFDEIKIAFRNPDLDIDTKIKILLSYYTLIESYPELKKDAFELCNILESTHPDDAKSFSMNGDFLYREQKFEEARINYRKALSLDKQRFAIWSQVLIIDSELNDFASMYSESKESIELFPNQSLPYFFNGAACLQLKKYQEGIDVLTEGKEFVFDNNLLLAQFYANIAEAQNSLKKYNESDASFDKALELDSKNPNVLNNYAYYLSLRKLNLEKAERMSKKSNDLAPNNSSYLDTYGWILYQQQKYSDAKVWIEKALNSSGRSSGTLLEHFGDVLYQLGEIDNALQYWNNAKKAGGASDLIDKKIADKKLYE
jgi:tetratricopeptide (TPR) repeat protein